MKYALNGFTLEVAAESVCDAALIADHYRELKLGSMHFADTEKLKANLARMSATLKAVESGTLVHTEVSTEKRPWFPVSAELGASAVKPYLALLQRITGYAGELPEFEFVPSDGGLRHTHILATCRVSSAGIKATGFMQSEDWNNQKAADRANPSFYDYVVEGFGYRKHEDEFKQAGNGHYVKNPAYLTRYAAQSGLGSPELWAQIFSWWRKTQATPGQLAVMQFSEANRLSWQKASDMDWDVRFGGGAEAYLIGNSGIRLTYTGVNGLRPMSWETFAKLTEWAPLPEPEPTPAEAEAVAADATAGTDAA